MIDAAQTFLLAFSALFSIVNPIGAALIFSQVTADLAGEARIGEDRLAERRVRTGGCKNQHAFLVSLHWSTSPLGQSCVVHR